MLNNNEQSGAGVEVLENKHYMAARFNISKDNDEILMMMMIMTMTIIIIIIKTSSYDG